MTARTLARPQRHHANKRALTRDDQGLTLIEMVVALGILMVVLGSTLGVFITVLKSQQVEQGTDRAIQLANSRLERIRQLNWNKIGFYDDTYNHDVNTAGCATPTTYNTYVPQDGTVPATTPPTYEPGSAANATTASTGTRYISVGTIEANTGADIIHPCEKAGAVITGDARNDFTVYTTITWDRARMGLLTIPTTSASGIYGIKRVRVTVVWKSGGNGATHQVSTESFFTPQAFQAAPPGVTVSTG